MNELEKLIFNTGEEIKEESTVEITSTVAKKVEELLTLQRTIEQKKEELSKLEKEERKLSGETIPGMLSDVGLSGVKLPDGTKIDTKTSWEISAKKDEKGRLFQWFVNHEPDMIDKVLSIPVKSVDKANEIATQLKDTGVEITFKEDLPHSSTLKAYFANKKKQNEEIPEQYLNVFQLTKTIIKKG